MTFPENRQKCFVTNFRDTTLSAISKIGFWFKVKAGAIVNPLRLLAGSSSRIRKYVEDLKREPGADIGPKDIFEKAYSHSAASMLLLTDFNILTDHFLLNDAI